MTPVASPCVQPSFVEGAGGLPIALWDLGGKGPPIMLAHATGLHTRCFRALAEGLTDRFRVFGFDCRGHGHSGTPALDRDEDGQIPTMGWATFAEDALAVIDSLGLRGTRGFGHSCGGAVLLLAEQLRPGTFSRIFTYEPVVAPPELWARLRDRGGSRSGAARRRRAVFPSRGAALEHYASKPPLSSLRSDVLADYVEGGFTDEPQGTVRLRCDPEAEAATFSMAAQDDGWARLPEVACPTTFACGGGATDFGLEMMTALAVRVQQGRVDEHAGLGHLGPLERPDEVAAAIGDAFGS